MRDVRPPLAQSGHSEPVRACIYCRLSRADDDDTTKVDDQEDLCRHLTGQRGWTVDPAHVFKDNNRSAWQRDRKRPGWDAMLAAVEAGQIDAIVIYHGDRLIRQPWDLEQLLRLAEKRGIRLASPTGTRNLDSADDRFILRIEAAQACKASDDSSRRIKRELERRRSQGLVRVGGRGGRAFGFEADGQTHVPAETALVAELGRRVLAGETVRPLCLDLDSRGVRTTAGNLWSHRTMRDMLMRPRYAGLMPDGVSPAAWEPVYDDDRDRAVEIWQAVVATLKRRTTVFPYATSTRKYELSGIAKCGGCGKGVIVWHHRPPKGNPAAKYRCVNKACKDRVTRSMPHVDALVHGVVLRLLNEPALLDLVAAEVDETLIVELATAEARKEKILADLADADDQTAKDVMRVTLPKLNETIAEKQAKVAAQRAAHTLASVAGISRADWEDLPLARRRAVTAQLVQVTIKPGAKRGRGFDVESVRIERDGPAAGLD